MTNAATMAVQPVDEVLPSVKLFILGLQHVLVMYAGAVAVPLILPHAVSPTSVGRHCTPPPHRGRGLG